MSVRVSMNTANIKRLVQNQKIALEQAVEAMKTDLIQSQTMPFDYGTLQNQATFVDASEINLNKVSIVSDMPYADRVYFHPEYKFQTINNKNAGGEWFEPYINGAKKNFVKNAYSKRLKALNERGV